MCVLLLIRVIRYDIDHPAFDGKDIVAGRYLEA